MSSSVSKAVLAANIATKHGLSKAAASSIIDDLFADIFEEVKNGNRVALAGVGTFSLSERAAREGRNPSTGASIKIAASRGVKFKASKTVEV